MDLHRQVLAAAERAADPREVDANLLGRQPEARRDLRAVDVEPLRRDVDVDAALAVGHREPRLGPEERLVLDPGLVRRPRPTTSPRASGSPCRIDDRPDDVRPRVVAVAVAVRRPVGMKLRALGRALHVGDRLERLPLDDDRLGRAPGLLRVLGGDERVGLAEVADAVDREHGLVAELEAVASSRPGRPRG